MLEGEFSDRIRTLDAGQAIVTQGESGHEMFVVLSGRAVVHTDGVTRATLEVGAFFGEMSVIDTRPRSATVVAIEDGTRILPIDRSRFLYLVSQQPAFALTVMAALSQRLRGPSIPAVATPSTTEASYTGLEIRPGLWQFRSRGRACNVYLVVGRHRAALIDTGLGSFYPSLEEALRLAGRAPDTLNLVVLTHEHADHVGGTPFLPATCTVAAHPLAANKLALRDAFATVSGVIGEEVGDVRVDLELSEGSIVDIDPYRFTVLHTPGHTSGCICLADPAQDLLICGDTVMAGGAMGGIFGSGNISDYIFSLKRLGQLGLGTLLPGHGRISTTGREDVAQAFARAQGLLRETRELAAAMGCNDAFDRIMGSMKDLNR